MMERKQRRKAMAFALLLILNFVGWFKERHCKANAPTEAKMFTSALNVAQIFNNRREVCLRNILSKDDPKFAHFG